MSVMKMSNISEERLNEIIREGVNDKLYARSFDERYKLAKEVLQHRKDLQYRLSKMATNISNDKIPIIREYKCWKYKYEDNKFWYLEYGEWHKLNIIAGTSQPDFLIFIANLKKDSI